MVSSTPRPLNATEAQNCRLRDQTDADVRGQHQHATSAGEVAQTRLGATKSASTISRLNQSLARRGASEGWQSIDGSCTSMGCISVFGNPSSTLAGRISNATSLVPSLGENVARYKQHWWQIGGEAVDHFLLKIGPHVLHAFL